MSEIQHRARLAKELLENETFNAVLDVLTAKAITEFRSSPAPAADQREAAASNLRGLDAIKAQLNSWISDAEFEAAKDERAKRRRAAS